MKLTRRGAVKTVVLGIPIIYRSTGIMDISKNAQEKPEMKKIK